MNRIKILYFAGLREQVGINQEEFELPAAIERVAQLKQTLSQRGDNWADCFSRDRSVMTAINQEMVKEDAPVKPDDEVAFFPPVTGG